MGCRRLPANPMHVSMPPDTPPPDDLRRPSSGDANVVDPGVLAERRAQRAEQSEQSAARRAADAQVLAAQLARERARLEAERDAARAEAAAAREGADAAIAEAAHVQAERDTLRDALAQARAERDTLRAEREAEPVEPVGASAVAEPAAAVANDVPRNGAPVRNGGGAPPIAWPAGLRRELTVARAAAAIAQQGPDAPPTAPASPAQRVPGLARERRLVERRPPAAPATGADAPQPRRGDRAAPVTALALERERSSRLQTQLDRSLAVQQELRAQLGALERAVQERVDAERRIELALGRVRAELTAANALQAAVSAPVAPAMPAPDASAAEHGPDLGLLRDPEPGAVVAAASPEPGAVVAAASPEPGAVVAAAPEPAPGERPEVGPAAEPATGLDPLRLSAARERLRATAVVEQGPVALPAGTPVPWMSAALQRLLQTEPETAGRLAVGLLPAQGLPARRSLRYDLLLGGQGCVAVDVEPGSATVRAGAEPRPRSAVDLRISAEYAGFARLLHGRRSLRRAARVRGGRRRLRELRRLARAPIGIRDLASAGVTLDPALALRLVALAIDPAATSGQRFAIAHAPLAGGPVDAWLRIADGTPPVVFATAPPEPVLLTLRCTRGALLPLIAGVAPPPGESGTLDGDTAILALLRGWITATEHPAA